MNIDMKNLTESIEAKMDRSKWHKWKISDLVENINEKVVPKDSGLEHYIGLEHLDSGSLHIRRFGETASLTGDKLKIYKGDLIFAKRNAYLKRVAIAEFDAVASAHSLVLRAKPENVLPEFLPFFMLSEKFWQRAIEISVGSLSPTINWRVLAKQEFLLPPKEQQAEIAQLLWAADDVMEKKSNLSVSIHESLSALIKDEAFDPCFGLKPLKTFYNIRRGASPRPINDPKYFAENGRGWIRISDVSKSKKFLNSTEQFLSELGVSKSVKVNEGDVVMSICATIGMPIIIDTPCCIHDGFVLFQPRCDNIIPEFLYYLLMHLEERFKSKRQMGTQGNLNTTIVGNTEIPILPLNAQREILKRINAVESALKVAKESLDSSKSLHKALINQVF